MKKIEELTNPDSCLNKADLSEPLFVLRANDPQAPALLRRWAVEYRERKEREGHWDARCQIKWEGAVTDAFKMEEWRKNKYAVRPRLDVEGCSQSKG